MRDLKWDVLPNPNGILYDPLSIADALFSYMENRMIFQKDLVSTGGLWHSWTHHSRYSGPNPAVVLENINGSVTRAHQFLKEARVLILTPGTAFGYRLKNDQRPVANCHKAPASLFDKILIPVEKIISSFSSVMDALEKFNPGLRIILTVSPVKHARDGVTENNWSKSRLIDAVQTLAGSGKVFYFPAYEWVTDVLRDYRFYKEDLVHPNDTALDFVFEKFAASFFAEPTRRIMEEIREIITATLHKPFFKESEGHRKFIASSLKKIAELESRYPFIDLSAEKKYFYP
jgi:hypothetical protein